MERLLRKLEGENDLDRLVRLGAVEPIEDGRLWKINCQGYAVTLTRPEAVSSQFRGYHGRHLMILTSGELRDAGIVLILERNDKGDWLGDFGKEVEGKIGTYIHIREGLFHSALNNCLIGESDCGWKRVVEKPRRFGALRKLVRH